jgi:hypothetical protein
MRKYEEPDFGFQQIADFGLALPPSLQSLFLKTNFFENRAAGSTQL